MVVEPRTVPGPERTLAGSIRWVWVAASVVGGGLLLALFLAVVDPGLDRPRVSGAVFAATLILTGMLAGFRSPGRTTWEPGLGGLALVLLAGIGLAVTGGDLPGPGPTLSALVLAPLLGIAGGWVGEMLQGTYRDDEVGVQWLWVLVAVVVGFMAGVYALYLAEAALGLDYLALIASFGASFMLTGLVVGYFSPGTTIVEPAIATAGIIVLDVAFCLVQFHALFPVAMLAIATMVGIVLSVTGAWIGEAAQDIRGR